mgnify:CR=1 FL=1
MSALVMIFVGIILVLIGLLGVLAVYLLMRYNVKDATAETGVLRWVVKRFFIFGASVFVVVSFISMFIGGLSLIDQGVKKWDSFSEVKK